MRLAVLFHRLGPYHMARLAAAGRHGELIAVELSGRDNTYAWDAADTVAGFRHMMVMPDSDVDRLPVMAYRAQLESLLDESGADVVAIAGWSAPWALAALRWCRRAGVPAVLMSDSTVEDAPRTPLKEAVKRRIVSQYQTALVAGSRHRAYVEALGMPAVRVFQGYDVVDNEHFSTGAELARKDASAVRARLGLPAQYFLASARFIPKKNLSGLLSGFARYREVVGDQAWDLVLLGDGPLRPQVEAEIARLGLTGHVQLPGFRQYPDLPAYYGLAEAFVHASTVEQWGLVVNEAMAAGLPVLVSARCGCAPDLVQAGVNGYTFEPDDIESFAHRLIVLASTGCNRAALGAASRRIIDHWTPALFADGLWRAAAAARESPADDFGLFDRVLLQGLLR